MAKKKTINVITAISDPIFGTTYKSQPVTPDSVTMAQKQYAQIKNQQKYKTRSERTKKK
ncbi:MAG: hypothetical protein IKB05_03045 [Alphaproteobacteria bacterium]|nr:hypothetical protein [Alphaproteobacteria bacterium]